MKTYPRILFTRILFGLIIFALLTGCDLIPGLGGKADMAPAEKLMPELSNYNIMEGEELTAYISSLSGGAAMLAGHPEIAVTIAGVDHIVTCYQDIGAVQARLYSNKDEPLQAGTVAIADKGALLNPINLFRCIQPPAKETTQSIQSVKIEPCTGNYTLERETNTLYILYAGTTMEMCDTFCANLEGCTPDLHQQK